MLEDHELADVLQEKLERVIRHETTPELRDAEVSKWPSDNAGFLVRLMDGTTFAVNVTQVKAED